MAGFHLLDMDTVLELRVLSSAGLGAALFLLPRELKNGLSANCGEAPDFL